MPLSSARSILMLQYREGENVRISQKPGGGNVQGATDQGKRPGEHVLGGKCYTPI